MRLYFNKIKFKSFFSNLKSKNDSFKNDMLWVVGLADQRDKWDGGGWEYYNETNVIKLLLAPLKLFGLGIVYMFAMLFFIIATPIVLLSNVKLEVY